MKLMGKRLCQFYQFVVLLIQLYFGFFPFLVHHEYLSDNETLKKKKKIHSFTHFLVLEHKYFMCFNAMLLEILIRFLLKNGGLLLGSSLAMTCVGAVRWSVT